MQIYEWCEFMLMSWSAEADTTTSPAFRYNRYVEQCDFSPVFFLLVLQVHRDTQ